jgi:glycosyltransferase involved in cell wall biosynthesis
MKNRIKILQIIPNFGNGGAEVVVKDILMGHDTDHFEMAACSLYPFSGTAIEKELQEADIKVFYLTKKLGPDVGILKGVYDIFNDFKPHVIHTHRYVIRYTLIPSLLCRIPVKIHTIHNIPNKEVDLAGRFIHFFAYHFFNYKPIGVSKNISDYASNYYRIENIPYIYNGRRFNSSSSKTDLRSKIRKSFDIGDDDIVFISVGRFYPQKNYRFLIETFKKVIDRQRNTILLMAGDGELRAELEHFATEIGLSDKVRFLGIRNDIADLLAASDVFVLTSDWEGLPLTVIEAMASGKPVIATAVGGVPELIADGLNGILVPPGDGTALAKAMVRMVQDFSSRKKMGELGRTIAQERFDIPNMVKGYSNIYIKEIKLHRQII